MKAALLLPLLLIAVISARADIGDARRFLKQGEAGKAAGLLAEMLKEKPNDPWLLYNAGVAEYAAGNYSKADTLWQQLATVELPEQLREQVWMQIGNVSFRLAKSSLEQQPDIALSKIQQSREAYRVAIAQNPDGETARKNLVFVEKQLEQFYVDLAARLVADAKKEKAHEPAIEKLHAALDHQRNATAMNPKEARHAQAEQEIKKLLAERFVGKAGESEKQGDRIAGQKSLDQEKLNAGRQEYERAIADFKQAQVFDAEQSEAIDGQPRVTGKLADMFAKAGRQEQKEGNAAAKKDPAKAVESYENALERFDEALDIVADHQDAQAGKREVKEALENLHLQEGDKMTKAGEEQIEKSPAEAVGNLLGALDHFEQAKTLNPENPEIPPRIEHVKKLLPEALVALGQRQQEQAKEAEPESVPNAVAHLEQAEATYEKALQLAPDHEAAQKGLKEVQEDLARLRKQLTQENPPMEPQPQPQQASQKKKQEPQTFEEMLAQAKAKQEKRDVNASRSAGAKYDPARTLGLKNW